MGMKLRLDTAGLRALIADNAELELEIGKEVLNNIRSDLVQKNVDDAVKLAVEGMLKDNGYWQSPRYTVKDPKMLEAINIVVNTTIVESMDKNIASKVSELVGLAVQAERIKLKAEIRDILKGVITPEMAREILLLSLNK